MRLYTPLRLAVTLALGPALLSACSLLMTEPAEPSTDVQIAFQLLPSPGGTETALSRVRRVFLRLTRPEGARDTVVAVVPVDGTLRAVLQIPTEERIDGLGIVARLGYLDELTQSPVALFSGTGMVTIVPGEPATALVPISPIPDHVVAGRGSLTMPGPASLTQLTAAVLYASDDTIEALPVLWTSEDPTVVSVTPTGLATALQLGQTRLVARFDTLADTVVVVVVPPPSRLRQWTAGNGGAWADPSNWAGGKAPALGDSVEITLDGTYTVDIGAAQTDLASLTLGGASGAQALTTTADMIVATPLVIQGTGALHFEGNSLRAPSVTVGASATLRLGNQTVVEAPVVNDGLLVADRGDAALTEPLTTSPTSTVRVGGGTFASGLTIPTGFTNEGTIEIGGSSRLTVTTGTLVNPPTGSISTITTTIFGGIFLTAELDNRGPVTLAQPLTIDAVGASHVNSGSIVSAANAFFTVTGADGFDNSGTLDVTNAEADISLSGAGAGFHNSGTIRVGPQLWIRNGPFQQTGGSITGSGSLLLDNLTGTLASEITLGTTAPTFLQIIGSTLTAPSVTTPSSTSLILHDGTLDAPLALEGSLSAIGGSTSRVTGAVTTTSTSRIAVEGSSLGSPVLAFDIPFTNDGNIQLDNSQAGAGAGITVAGTLANGSTGHIVNFAGAGGGARTISADVSNVGTITLHTPLTIAGELIDPAGAPSAYDGNGFQLTVRGLNVEGPLFNNMPLVVEAGTFALQNTGFVGMDPTATQLTIKHVGAALPATIIGANFATTPTTGLYLSVNDLDAVAPFLTVEVLTSTPASGGALSATSGGAVLIW